MGNSSQKAKKIIIKIKRIYSDYYWFIIIIFLFKNFFNFYKSKNRRQLITWVHSN